jgi:arylsulfatase A-like enzyme
VGRVLDELAARDLANQTIVVCVSDHGEEFWEHGGVEHGHTLYDELLRAVLVIRWPGHLPAGRRVTSVVSTVDVAATLRDLAGIADASPTDGVSLRAVMHGEQPRNRALLSENILFGEERVAIRTDTTKLIRWENGKEEAYDLVRDPQERRDLAGVETFVAPLRAELAELERTMAPSVSPVATAPVAAAGLRALGYLQ